MAQRNEKGNGQANPVAEIWQREMETLIDNFIAEGGSSSPSENINFLLSSWFSSREGSELEYSAQEVADIVFSATSTVTFIVKLNEYWAHYKEHCLKS